MPTYDEYILRNGSWNKRIYTNVTETKMLFSCYHVISLYYMFHIKTPSGLDASNNVHTTQIE